jgi:hypothetical protein
MARKGRLIALASAGGAAVVLVLLAGPAYDLAMEEWLLRRLDSAAGAERLEAARGLGERGSLRALGPLFLAAAAQSDDARRSIEDAIDAIVTRRGPAAARRLGELLRDGVVGYPAACRLGCMGEAAMPAIAAALDDPGASVRWLALHALLGLGPDGKAAAPRVADLLLDPDIAVREHARTALAGMDRDLKWPGR